MKCPSCSLNHKARDGRVCSRCKYRFVFDPKVDRMTDNRWRGLIDSTSGKGTYHFTPNQLFTTLCRQTRSRLGPKFFRKLVVALLIMAVAFFPLDVVPSTEHGYAALLLRFGLIAGLLALGWINNRGKLSYTPPTHTTFEDQMRRWEEAHPTPKLVTRATLHSPPPEWTEDDIYDYGLEGLLIVDDDRLVDLLILNGFHAEQRCAVVSRSGYPSYVLPHVKKALAARTDMPVFVLHAATVEGRRLAYILKELDLGVADHPVTDLGWSSGDFLQVSKLQLFDADNWDGATKVDILPPRQLHALLSSAMRDRVPLSAFMGREEAAGAWTSDGDRLWVDVSDYG